MHCSVAYTLSKGALLSGLHPERACSVTYTLSEGALCTKPWLLAIRISRLQSSHMVEYFTRGNFSTRSSIMAMVMRSHLMRPRYWSVGHVSEILMAPWAVMRSHQPTSRVSMVRLWAPRLMRAETTGFVENIIKASSCIHFIILNLN